MKNVLQRKNQFGGLTAFWYGIREHPLMRRVVDIDNDEYNKMCVLYLKKEKYKTYYITVVRTSARCFKVYYQDTVKALKKSLEVVQLVLDIMDRYFDKEDFYGSLSGQEYNMFVAGLLSYEYPSKKVYKKGK